MEICKNKRTGKVFIYLDDRGDGQALMITPQGIVLSLDHDLFTEPIEIDNDKELMDQGHISPDQYNLYCQYAQK